MLARAAACFTRPSAAMNSRGIVQAADRKVLHRALRLGAPQRIGRHLQLAHAVALGTERRRHAIRRLRQGRMRYRLRIANISPRSIALPPAHGSTRPHGRRFALDALSPVDGRYRAATEPLRGLMSEGGLIRERIRVEALWVAASRGRRAALRGLELCRPRCAPCRRALARDPPADAAAGRQGDRSEDQSRREGGRVLRSSASSPPRAPREATLELVHFGCTSEDINNVSYARMLVDARDVLLETLETLIAQRSPRSRTITRTCRCSRARTASRQAPRPRQGSRELRRAPRVARSKRWAAVAILGKWNGAVGNFNAHVAAAAGARLAGRESRLRRVARPASTTRTPRRSSRTTGSREYCDAVAAIDTVLIDLCRDFWGYISLGYFRQRPNAGEVGSSTMPHKVNPIDFENAEGNLGVANALLRHFADKLPISRWQRDLTDSTVLRNLGVALAPCAHRVALARARPRQDRSRAPRASAADIERSLGSARRGRADRAARRRASRTATSC